MTLEELDELGLTTEQHESLVKRRGGCTCFISPPCNPCVEPVTLDEALSLGFIEEDPAVVPVDHMHHVRALCR